MRLYILVVVLSLITSIYALPCQERGEARPESCPKVVNLETAVFRCSGHGLAEEQEATTADDCQGGSALSLDRVVPGRLADSSVRYPDLGERLLQQLRIIR